MVHDSKENCSGVKALKQLVLIAALGLVACNEKPTPELVMSSVSIYAEPDANDNSAIAVDLVLVYNNELLGTLAQMSASKYFASSNQLLLDNPTLLDIWHWELVPGQIVQNFKPSQEKGNAFGAFVFANYLTPGDHRIKVAPDGVVNILLSKKDLKNLAASGSGDVKRGTTMTEDVSESKTTVGIVNKGPTHDIPQSCKRKVQKINQQMEGKPTVCSKDSPPPCKPIPIVTQPCPPLMKKSSSQYNQR